MGEVCGPHGGRTGREQMSIVRKFVTKDFVLECEVTRRDAEFVYLFKVVPATSFELARLAAGDFKFLVDPSNINGLTREFSHEKGFFYRERDKHPKAALP
jgi:hypothetical protein